MAFKLTKPERDAGSKHGQLIKAKSDEINALMEELREMSTDFHEWRNDVVGRLRDEFGEKSEKWQEGDRAQIVSDWIDEIENIEIDEPDDIDAPDIDEEFGSLLDGPEF